MTLLIMTVAGCEKRDPEVPAVKFASTAPAVASLILQWPSFSPDGSLVVCILRSYGTSELYSVPLVLDAPAMRPRPLPMVPGVVEGLYSVSWHPNSKEIAFTLIDRDSGHFGIWLFDVEKNQVRPLVPGGKNQLLQYPLFSPDGNFVVSRNAVDSMLMVCNVASREVQPVREMGTTTRVGYGWGENSRTIWASNGSNLLRTSLDHSEAEQIAAPEISILVSSPNGKTLACLRVTAIANPSDKEYHLALFDTDSRSVTDLNVATNNIPLSWHPDGRSLAYVRDGRIWVYDVATKEHHAVTPTDVEASYPFWHPKDGTLWCVIGNRAIARVTDGRTGEAFSLDKTDPTATSRPSSQGTR